MIKISPLTLVLGSRGSGKTFFCVTRVRKSERQIFSNFKINLKNYNKLKLVDLLFLPKNIELVMDEGYAIIDSRISMSYINIYSSYLAFQLRKTDTNIFITAQQLSSIDKRYRNEWDYLVECERVPNEEENWRYWDFNFTIYDKRKNTASNWIFLYQDAFNIFDLYDTMEIVEPRNKSRIEYEFLKDDPEQMTEKGYKITNYIKKDINKVTKDAVEYALMKNGYDGIWAKTCYLILKNYVG